MAEYSQTKPHAHTIPVYRNPHYNRRTSPLTGYTRAEALYNPFFHAGMYADRMRIFVCDSLVMQE